MVGVLKTFYFAFGDAGKFCHVFYAHSLCEQLASHSSQSSIFLSNGVFLLCYCIVLLCYCVVLLCYCSILFGNLLVTHSNCLIAIFYSRIVLVLHIHFAADVGIGRSCAQAMEHIEHIIVAGKLLFVNRKYVTVIFVALRLVKNA